MIGLIIGIVCFILLVWGIAVLERNIYMDEFRSNLKLIVKLPKDVAEKRYYAELSKSDWAGNTPSKARAYIRAYDAIQKRSVTEHEE